MSLIKETFKWILLVDSLMWLTQTVFAATHYRNHYIYVPDGVCMVEFYGNTINASLIAEVYAGELRSSKLKPKDGFLSIGYDWVYTDFMAIRVKLVNGFVYDITTATKPEAEMRKVAFLQSIKDTCK